MKKSSQNWKNIYVLLFKTMEIIKKIKFILMNVKKFKQNPFDKI
jgi:hypothetical protein